MCKNPANMRNTPTHGHTIADQIYPRKPSVRVGTPCTLSARDRRKKGLLVQRTRGCIIHIPGQKSTILKQ